MTGPEAALSGRDVRTLERTTKRYQVLGLDASLRIDQNAYGQATIWHVDPINVGADTYQLDIRKRWGLYGRVVWTISVSRSRGLTFTMKDIGQITSAILLFALTKAELLIADAKDAEAQDRKLPEVAPIKIGRAELASLNKIADTTFASWAKRTVPTPRGLLRKQSGLQELADLANILRREHSLDRLSV